MRYPGKTIDEAKELARDAPSLHIKEMIGSRGPCSFHLMGDIVESRIMWFLRLKQNLGPCESIKHENNHCPDRR